ncbi:helix-hairpin-helix domain-containing protein [Ramlibacter sp. MMS24-I3-19]|uniref:helix-hairpin-helix domain-containing protein n=1 Tax=Ramlibacter sp. MMS24-I3-19 TaxID=3416606 RepID=UPI003D04ED68
MAIKGDATAPELAANLSGRKSSQSGAGQHWVMKQQTGQFGRTAVAEALDDMAGLLEVQGENPFRVRAYKTAARVVSNLAPGMLLDAGKLDGMRGIGKDLAAKIVEIARTGTCGQLDTLRLQVPPVVLELLHVPGIGPQRVVAMRRALQVNSLDQLRKAAEEGRLRTVHGFGPKLEQRILDALHARLDKRARVPLEEALEAGRRLLGDLASMEGVLQVLRRAACAGASRMSGTSISWRSRATRRSWQSASRPCRRCAASSRAAARAAAWCCTITRCRSICGWSSPPARGQPGSTSPGPRRTTSRCAGSRRPWTSS